MVSGEVVAEGEEAEVEVGMALATAAGSHMASGVSRGRVCGRNRCRSAMVLRFVTTSETCKKVPRNDLHPDFCFWEVSSDSITPMF